MAHITQIRTTAPDNCLFVPLHGNGAALTVNAISPGTITRLTLSAAVTTAWPGCYTYVSGLTAPHDVINGVHRIVAQPGDRQLDIDYDSTGLVSVSGLSATATLRAAGALGATLSNLSGTLTNIWSDPAHGLKFPGSVYATIPAADIAWLSMLDGPCQIVACADVWIVSNGTLSAAEDIFQIGSNGGTNANHPEAAGGCIGMRITTARAWGPVYRDGLTDPNGDSSGVATDTAGTVSTIGGDGTNPTRYHLGVIWDVAADGSILQIPYLNAVQKSVRTPTSVGTARMHVLPETVSAIGARVSLSTVSTATGLGAGGSGISMENLLIARTEGFTKAVRALTQAYRVPGVIPEVLYG